MRDRLKLIGAAATTVLLTLAPATAVWADSGVTASNSSGSIDGSSGDARASNSDSAMVGQGSGGDTRVSSSDVSNSGSAGNVQEGDNKSNVTQTVNTKSG